MPVAVVQDPDDVDDLGHHRRPACRYAASPHDPDGHETHRDIGFTLIELLVVIVILGVLAVVAALAIGGITDRGTVSAEAADGKTVETAQEAHMAQHGVYTDEPGLVAAGLLRDESQLVDVELLGDGAGYTIGAAGSFVPVPTTTTPPPGPVATTYAGSAGISVGTGAKTLVIIGDGAGSGALWTMLEANQPTDTEVIWLNAGDIATSADVDAVVIANPDYIVAAYGIAITTPSGRGHVGSYMNATYPGTYWWTFGHGRNPTLAELEVLLA